MTKYFRFENNDSSDITKEESHLIRNDDEFEMLPP